MSRSCFSWVTQKVWEKNFSPNTKRQLSWKQAKSWPLSPLYSAREQAMNICCILNFALVFFWLPTSSMLVKLVSMRLYNVPQWGFCLGFPCEKCWHAKLSWKLTQKKQVKKRTTQYTHLPPLPEYSSPIGSTEGKQEGKYKKDQNWRFTSDIGREDITTPCLKIQYTVFSNFFFSFLI